MKITRRSDKGKGGHLLISVPSNRLVEVESALNFLEVQHQRLFGAVVAKRTELDVTVETRGRDHARELVEALSAEGFKVRVLEGADA